MMDRFSARDRRGDDQVRVRVDHPAVAGDTVVFRWSQTEPNPFQEANEFFFRYEGLDLSAFSPLLLYEVFLGLQLKVFAAYGKPIELVFPEPVPRSTAAYWTAFHDADPVSIEPIAEAVSYDPWTVPSTSRASIGCAAPSWTRTPRSRTTSVPSRHPGRQRSSTSAIEIARRVV
jgi:hypothetical protein